MWGPEVARPKCSSSGALMSMLYTVFGCAGWQPQTATAMVSKVLPWADVLAGGSVGPPGGPNGADQSCEVRVAPLCSRSSLV
jgi:hypothetical protein